MLFQICRCLGTCFWIQATLQFKIMTTLDAVAGTLSSDFCHFSSARWSRAWDCLCGSQQQRLMNVDRFMQSDLHDSIWALYDFHRGWMSFDNLNECSTQLAFLEHKLMYQQITDKHRSTECIFQRINSICIHVN